MYAFKVVLKTNNLVKSNQIKSSKSDSLKGLSLGFNEKRGLSIWRGNNLSVAKKKGGGAVVSQNGTQTPKVSTPWDTDPLMGGGGGGGWT